MTAIIDYGLNGTQRRVKLDVEVDAEAKQRVYNLLLSFTKGLVYFGRFHIVSFFTKHSKHDKTFFLVGESLPTGGFPAAHGCVAAAH